MGSSSGNAQRPNLLRAYAVGRLENLSRLRYIALLLACARL